MRPVRTGIAFTEFTFERSIKDRSNSWPWPWRGSLMAMASVWSHLLNGHGRCMAMAGFNSWPQAFAPKASGRGVRRLEAASFKAILKKPKKMSKPKPKMLQKVSPSQLSQLFA
ncbi:hypothetical protein L596_014141 [Steinernema carpocapsae]|uniref:Uncharacterized protein n=1 Tax=Steinernema carpocapsae TaxID=34508 RepID=A0A4U5NC65_STECR|nr:hypothetical protein L596_014141 [Steinernema carpocapsae]